MYKVWTASAAQATALARSLESHLNEYAEEIISVSYAVTDVHHVLAVYRMVDLTDGAGAEAAVAAAEELMSAETEPS
jgi:hypothetical protein